MFFRGTVTNINLVVSLCRQILTEVRKMAETQQESFDAVQKALSDLSTAVDNETTQSNAVADEVKQLLQDGRNAVSAAQWQQVADKIEAKVSQMQTNNQNISAVLASATAPPAASTDGPVDQSEPQPTV